MNAVKADNPNRTNAMLTALEVNGHDEPQLVMNAVAALLDTVSSGQSVEDLFLQKNPKFPEGSAPLANSHRGELVHGMLHAMLALDYRTDFKVGMDGFGMHAGGMIVLNQDNFDHFLVAKGDDYNVGRIGVLGGLGKDEDEGDDFTAALREHGAEIGKFPFDPTRLFYFFTANEWRTTDTRVEAYWLKSSYYIYLATSGEMDAMQEGYKVHALRTKRGDGEIAGLLRVPRRGVLEAINSGRMINFDQTQAFVMVALCIPLLETARTGLAAMGITEPSHEQVWRLATLLADKRFKGLTDLSEGDWRPKLPVDTLMA